MKKRKPASLQGTAAHHASRARAELDHAVAALNTGACHDALLSLGSASAHMGEDADESPLQQRWNRIEDLAHKRCRFR
jgi:hypothetical protein